MNKSRIEALSDGVFAIVMTLIVIEIKVPHLKADASDAKIWAEIFHLMPLFGAYVLSFAVLVSYWVSHYYLISFMAKNIDRVLGYLNMLFLMAVALIPFSASLLGFYNQNQLSVFWYGGHLLIIAAILYGMRAYLIATPKIENSNLEPQDARYAKIRIWIPIIMTILGILVSFVSINLALFCFITPLFITTIPGSVAFLDRKVGRFLGK